MIKYDLWAPGLKIMTLYELRTTYKLVSFFVLGGWNFEIVEGTTWLLQALLGIRVGSFQDFQLCWPMRTREVQALFCLAWAWV